MYEIQFSELEKNKKYYIESNKKKFKHFGYFQEYFHDHENIENNYAIFKNVQRINRNSKYIKYFICYRNKKNWKYYVPEIENIIKNFEKNNLQLILRNITNDYSFIC